MHTRHLPTCPSQCRVVLLLAALALTTAGCSALRSPFEPREEDYARTLALSRLRDIEPMAIDASRAPVQPDISAEKTIIEAVTQARAQFEAMQTLPLTVEECRKSALENNLSLRVALIDPAIASERVTEEDQRWNSIFQVRAQYADGRQATGSRVSSAESKNFELDPQLIVPTRSGGTISIPLNLSWQQTNNEFSELPEFYSVGPGVSISQELLRGAGRRVQTAQLRIAGYEQQASELRTKLEAIRELSDVDRAYWRLYAARATLDVRVNQFELAMAQLERAQRRVREGLSPEVEVDRARAGVAQRLEGVVLAQNDILLRQRELKRIINTPGLEMDTAVAILPQSPPDPVQYAFDLATLQEQAIANRAELTELELQLAADAARILLERDGTLPQLSATVGYFISGVDKDLIDATDNAADRQSRRWSVGLEGSMPLDNEAARARLRRAILTRIQRLASKDQREQTIRREVLDAADSLDTNWKRILAARQAALAAARALESEQRQFDLGRSTSTDVLDAASNLAQAQQAEVQALTDYQLSQVDLAQASGTLLGAMRVTLEPASAPSIAGPDPQEPE